ncbi:MAG: hypothetical protein ACYC1E_10795 [Propionibacteriaceae bacterium]
MPRTAGEGTRASKLEGALAELIRTTAGAECAAVIDIATGITLAKAGEPAFGLDTAAQGFATAVRYQLRTALDLGLVEPAEAVLFSQGSHHHVFGVRTPRQPRGAARLPRRPTGRRCPVGRPPPRHPGGQAPAALSGPQRVRAGPVRERRHHHVPSMTTRIAIVRYQE